MSLPPRKWPPGSASEPAKSIDLQGTGEVFDSVREHDVLLGRGPIHNKHKGNITFRELVRSKMEQYANCKTKSSKDKTARMVVHEIALFGGRFLRKVEQPFSEETPMPSEEEQHPKWEEVDEKTILIKVKQTFRDLNSADRKEGAAAANTSQFLRARNQLLLQRQQHASIEALQARILQRSFAESSSTDALFHQHQQHLLGQHASAQHQMLPRQPVVHPNLPLLPADSRYAQTEKFGQPSSWLSGIQLQRPSLDFLQFRRSSLEPTQFRRLSSFGQPFQREEMLSSTTMQPHPPTIASTLRHQQQNPHYSLSAGEMQQSIRDAPLSLPEVKWHQTYSLTSAAGTLSQSHIPLSGFTDPSLSVQNTELSLQPQHSHEETSTGQELQRRIVSQGPHSNNATLYQPYLLAQLERSGPNPQQLLDEQLAMQRIDDHQLHQQAGLHPHPSESNIDNSNNNSYDFLEPSSIEEMLRQQQTVRIGSLSSNSRLPSTFQSTPNIHLLGRQQQQQQQPQQQRYQQHTNLIRRHTIAEAPEPSKPAQQHQSDHDSREQEDDRKLSPEEIQTINLHAEQLAYSGSDPFVMQQPYPFLSTDNALQYGMASQLLSRQQIATLRSNSTHNYQHDNRLVTQQDPLMSSQLWIEHDVGFPSEQAQAFPQRESDLGVVRRPSFGAFVAGVASSTGAGLPSSEATIDDMDSQRGQFGSVFHGSRQAFPYASLLINQQQQAHLSSSTMERSGGAAMSASAQRLSEPVQGGPSVDAAYLAQMQRGDVGVPAVPAPNVNHEGEGDLSPSQISPSLFHDTSSDESKSNQQHQLQLQQQQQPEHFFTLKPPPDSPP